MGVVQFKYLKDFIHLFTVSLVFLFLRVLYVVRSRLQLDPLNVTRGISAMSEVGMCECKPGVQFKQ